MCWRHAHHHFAVFAAPEQADTASPASSFDFNDFNQEAVHLNYTSLGNGGYANPFLMPDLPMDLDAFTENFGWVSTNRGSACSINVLADTMIRVASRWICNLQHNSHWAE